MNRSQNISKEPEQKASRTPKQGTKGSPHGFEKEVDEYRNDCIVKKKIRIALFGSFYKGFFMLSELLYGQISNIVTVVGMATDDPTQLYTRPTKRVWQYPHTKYEEQMVKELAKENDIDTYVGRVRTKNFYQMFETLWRPEVCIMATFGQLIDSRLFSYPKYGFYNLHPCYDETWPSYPGGNPFQEIIHDKKKHIVMAMHRVDEYFDNGELVAFSDRVYIPKATTVVDMHKLTSPIAAKFAASQLMKILGDYKDKV